MSDEIEYRIDFTILTRGPGEEDFKELGFGSTVPASRIDSCGFDVLSQTQNQEWDYV